MMSSFSSSSSGGVGNNRESNDSKLRTYSKTSIREANKHLEQMHNEIVQLKEAHTCEKKENEARITEMQMLLMQKDMKIEELKISVVKTREVCEKLIAEQTAKLDELLGEKHALSLKLNTIKKIANDSKSEKYS